jgi:hypothetical protein
MANLLVLLLTVISLIQLIKALEMFPRFTGPKHFLVQHPQTITSAILGSTCELVSYSRRAHLNLPPFSRTSAKTKWRRAPLRSTSMTRGVPRQLATPLGRIAHPRLNKGACKSLHL